MLKELIAGKNMFIILLIIGVLVLSGGSVVFGKMYVDAHTEAFEKPGHIIIANEQAESQVHNFSSGTKYVKKLGGNYAFTDNDHNEIEIPNESVVFYEDNAASTLKKSVVLDISDTESDQFINHYLLPEKMEIGMSVIGYSIENADDTIMMEEGLWKISDNKYMVLANKLSIDFGNNDIRQVKTYAQINYIDEGVIQIVTDENVWQTVSSEAKIVTDKGAIIHLFDQYVEYKDTKMTFSKLVIDVDDHIELSPLETRKQTVPEFDITGSNGKDGADGKKGGIGATGKLGEDGEDGEDGDDGEDGKDGQDVIFESTVKTDLPLITLKEFDVNAMGLVAKYSVKDQNEMMSTDDYVSIKLYEAGAGEAIDCVTLDGISNEFPGYGEVSFKNSVDLKPDTEYSLVISGKYIMNGTKYEREFLSRVFYTDSLGVRIEKESVTTDALHLVLKQKEYSNAVRADVYLLTEEQAKQNFDPTDYNNSYISKSIRLQPRTTEEHNVDFTGLPRNQKYVVRLVVHMEDSSATYLSQQALKLATLKAAPTMSGVPSVTNNRSAWGFELYGGIVSDPDHAIISYQYEIYEADSILNKPIKTIDVSPSQTSRMTMLYIDDQTIKASTADEWNQYYFIVKTIYNDNEKIIETKSIQSPLFSMSGSQLPAVYYENQKIEDSQGNLQEILPTKDRFTGQLTVVSNGSFIKADADHPLRVDVDCEGVYSRTLSFDTIDLNQNSSGAHYVGGVETSNVMIPVSCAGLSEGKTYRLTVSALVNTHDTADENYTYQVLGHVVVKTPAITTLQAKWTNTNNTTNVISKNLSIKSMVTNTNAEFASTNDAKTMSSIVVQLLDANTMSIVAEKTFKATREVGNDTHYFNSSLVNDFVLQEYEITEETMGIDNQENLTSSSYILRLKTAYDYTEDYFRLNTDSTVVTNGYVNEYPIDVTTRDVQINRSLQPPTLPISQLDEQINAVKIVNSQAPRYLSAVDEDLDDNTTVGYELSFAYSNSARLARKVHVYVFETEDMPASNKANTVYNFENHTLVSDTAENRAYISHYTIDVQKNSYTLPRVAIMFSPGTTASINNGQTMVVYDENLERGHHYTFAYVVEYTTVDEEGVDQYTTNYYPYNHPNFNSMSDPNDYLLRSKNQDTPRQLPKIYSYITHDERIGDNRNVTFKYMFEDADHTMVTTGDDATKLMAWDVERDVVYDGWGELTASHTGNPNALSLSMTVDLYVTGEPTPTVVRRSLLLDKDTIDDESIFVDNMKDETAPFRVTYDQSQLNKNLLTISIDNIPDRLLQKMIAVKIDFFNEHAPSQVVTSTTQVTLNGNSVAITMGANNLRRLINRIETEMDANTHEKYGMIQAKLSIIYDTGYQGWDLVALNAPNAMDGYALQIVSSGLKYAGYDSTTQSIIETDTAKGSMFRTQALGDMSLLSSDSSVEFKYYPKQAGSERMMPSALSVTNTGILVSNTTNSADKRVLVPKKMDSFEVGVGVDGENVIYTKTLDQLTAIIPSATNKTYIGNTSSIQMEEFAVLGIGEIGVDSALPADDQNVYFEIKKNGAVVGTRRFPINSFTYNASLDTYYKYDLIIDNLDINTTYVISAYVNMVNDQGQVERFDLLAQSQYAGDIVRYWSITCKTAEFVEATNGRIVVRNDIYAKKRLEATYNLSQTIDINIEYQISRKNEDDTYQIIYNTQQMTENGMLASIKPPANYMMAMNDLIDLDAGKHGELQPGETYYLEVIIKDGDGNRIDDIDNTLRIPFVLPVPSEPLVFSDMWVYYDTDAFGQEVMMLQYDFNVTDQNKVIMSDYTTNLPTSNDQIYYAVLYQVVSRDNQVVYVPIQDQNGEDIIYECKPGIMNSATIPVNTDETYVMKFYATLDMNHDGKADQLTQDVTTCINPDLFRDYKDELMIYERSPYMTPSASGISLGTQTLISTPTDSSKITIRYKNATKLEEIYSVEYTIIDAFGTHYNETITQPDLTFRVGGNGFYFLDLPTGLMNTGVHQVTVQYYVMGENGPVALLDIPYSDTYIY